MTITLSPENAAAVAEFCGLIAWTPEQLANHLLAEALDLFADPRSGSLEGFLGAIDYPDRATAQRVLARVAQIVTIQFDGKLPESFQGQKAGGDRSDKSGGPGTNRWMKEQGKYRYLVFRPLCACGRKVSVHQFDSGSPLRFGVSFDLSLLAFPMSDRILSPKELRQLQERYQKLQSEIAQLGWI